MDILHAGSWSPPHVQRLRQDQADRAPRARIVRKTRDATAGLTVTRLANHDGQLTFAGTAYRAGPMCPHLHRRHHRRRVSCTHTVLITGFPGSVRAAIRCGIGGWRMTTTCERVGYSGRRDDALRASFAPPHFPVPL